MKKQIVIATITLGLALAPASVSWAQTSGTDSSVSGSSKMGTGSAGKAGSHGMSNHPSGNAAKSQKMHNNSNGQ